MERVVEPELMSDDEQARAYASADFEEAHSRYARLFLEQFPQRPERATVLDLGCGPCDVTIRFARALPGWTFDAVDGSPAMLKQARDRTQNDTQIRLIKGFIPKVSLPRETYDAIISTSFLHHLHDPMALWQTVRRCGRKGTLVFVADLFRPASREAATAMMEKYTQGEPEVLRRDFYNSLLAAFTPEEVREQLRAAGLGELNVREVSDRHLVVAGTIR